MKNNIMKLCVASFLIISILAFASAAVSFDKTSYSLDKSSDYLVFTVSSNNISDPTVTLSINDIRFTLNETSLSANTTKQIKVSYNYENDFDLELFESASFTLSAKDGSTTVVSVPFNFPATYCKLGNQGKIKIVDLEDEELDNEDEWNWRPLNNIEIAFTIENNEDEDDDMSGNVEYCLWDDTNEECVIEGDFDFDVDGDDEEDYTIEFKVDPSDLDPSVKSYTFYVKAYDDDDFSEEEQCYEVKESVKVKINSNEVIVDEDDISFPLSVNAGETITVEVPVINIGSKEQEDVSVKMYSRTFNIDSQTVIVGDIKSGKSKTATFTLVLPTSLVEGKSYEILFDVYDEDDDLYEYEDGDGDDIAATFSKVFKIDSGAANPSEGNTSLVSISAELVGESKAGEKISVSTKITNVGTSRATFLVSAIGYSAWANSVSSDQNILLLQAGESKDVTFTFDSKKEASGTNRFNIEVISNDQVIASQSASLEIEAKGGWFNFTFGDNWYLWLIGAFNLFLILAIVFVIIRLFFK